MREEYQILKNETLTSPDDKESTDDESPEIQPLPSIKDKIFKFIFWIFFIIFFLKPLLSTLILFWEKDAIVLSYHEKEKASSFHFNQRVLCNMMSNKNTSSYCKSYDVVDVLDLAWAIAPLYTCRGDVDTKLYNLHKNFIGYLNAYGIPSITIEAVKVNSDQKYQIARPNMEPYEMQSHIHNCSFLRENLLNVAIRKLKLPWEYMMWVDAHQVFEDPMWIYKGIVLAEKYASVQLYRMARRLNPTNTSIFTKQGFVSASIIGRFLKIHQVEFGNAFILRRELYEKIGYILDECIANDCDVTYNKAAYPEFVWEYDLKFPKYTKSLSGWLEKAKKVFNGSRAYLTSDLYHISHQGSTFPWEDLHRVLEWTDFNISRDIKRDEDFAVYVSNDTIAQLMENAILSAK